MLPVCLIVAQAALPASADCSRELEQFGLRPYRVRDMSSALDVVDQWRFDAVLVDATGRAATSMASLPSLRERARAPIVLLSPDGDEAWQLEALRGGATEVIVTPASPRLVAAKLHRLVEMAHRVPAAANDERDHVLQAGPLCLDPRRFTASVGREVLAVTAGEFELLWLLASRPGEFVSRGAIDRALEVPDGARRSADMHVCRLRKKLRLATEGGRVSIDTIHGRGYCLSVAEPAGSGTRQDRGSGTPHPGFALEQPRKARSPGAAGRRPPPL